MHFYFLTRGIQQQIELFKMFMQSQFFKWTRRDLKTEKDIVHQVQGALRPINLWEYVFPEECLNEVLTMLNIENKGNVQHGHGSRDKINAYGISNAKMFALRKMLGKGIKPVPEYEKVPTAKFIELRGIALYPIGIKSDLKEKKETWGYDQEML